jgi:hypothetical protein
MMRIAGWFALALAAIDDALLADTTDGQSLLMRLEPASRAKVLMALLALVLVGLGLIALAWLGGRHLRRIARLRPGPTNPRTEDWYHKPLVPPDSDPPATGEPE